MVDGRRSVKAVYSVEYHSVPIPLEKLGAQAFRPWLYVYGAITKKGGKQRTSETSHPAANPSST